MDAVISRTFMFYSFRLCSTRIEANGFASRSIPMMGHESPKKLLFIIAHIWQNASARKWFRHPLGSGTGL
jgi:hypothetical protein